MLDKKLLVYELNVYQQSVSPGIVDSNFIQASGYTLPDSSESVFDDMPKLKPEGHKI